MFVLLLLLIEFDHLEIPMPFLCFYLSHIVACTFILPAPLVYGKDLLLVLAKSKSVGISPPIATPFYSLV